MNRLAIALLPVFVAAFLLGPGAAAAKGVEAVQPDAGLVSSAAGGTLVIVITVLTPPEGIGPQDFVVRVAGPEGIVEVRGSGEGTVVAPVAPGEYRLVEQQGPPDLEYIQTNNGPVTVPDGGSATLTITNAVPAMSSISTEPSTAVQAATTLPAVSATPSPSWVDAGGGGLTQPAPARPTEALLAIGAALIGLAVIALPAVRRARRR